jgi:DNA (cytosine-5)-methyltransferase 1
MRPKVVFLENVKNLVNHDHGNTMKVIEKSLRDRNYSFQSKVLNTKDYGNIPHNRERIFMVAFDLEVIKNAESLFEFPEKEKLSKTIKDVILVEKADDKVDDGFYYNEDRYMFDMLQNEMTSKETVYQFRRQYVRENKSNVCPTLTANMGTGGHNVPLIKTDFGFRKLTPRECFRFQGFPDTFKIPEIANSHLYKQAGNSVSVPVIHAVSKSIMKVLNTIEIE